MTTFSAYPSRSSGSTSTTISALASYSRGAIGALSTGRTGRPACSDSTVVAGMVSAGRAVLPWCSSIAWNRIAVVGFLNDERQKKSLAAVTTYSALGSHTIRTLITGTSRPSIPAANSRPAKEPAHNHTAAVTAPRRFVAAVSSTSAN
ncbi:MAG: hypothetical protein KF841_14545, partial [Phycisphaerae bacterium]|nr:hypothetical protein [Phycisphaerae bacterium]